MGKNSASFLNSSRNWGSGELDNLPQTWGARINLNPSVWVSCLHPTIPLAALTNVDITK